MSQQPPGQSSPGLERRMCCKAVIFQLFLAQGSPEMPGLCEPELMAQESSQGSNSLRILGMAGSLRRGSYNRGVLKAATQLLPENTSLDIFELDGIPGFNQDDEQNPPAKIVEF